MTINRNKNKEKYKQKQNLKSDKLKTVKKRFLIVKIR